MGHLDCRFQRRMKFKLLHHFLFLASLGVHGHGPGGGKPLEGSPEAQGPRVKTALGWIEGTYKKTEPGAKKFSSYEGIPYAVPPYDGLRFKPPVKHDNFYRPHEPLMATKPAAECPQLVNGEYKGSEDCLYLNVFTPQLDSIGQKDIAAQEDEIETEEDIANPSIIDEKIEDKIIEDDEFQEVDEGNDEDDEFGEVEEGDDEDEGFDPIKEMMKLAELEEREGKEFRDHLRALNVDLKELGLDDEGGWEHDEL